MGLVDFPLFEYSDTDERYVARHHPFTSAKDNPNLEGSLDTMLANAYDIVLNGYELGGGSIITVRPKRKCLNLA